MTLPKPMTSGAKSEGRFGKQDFVYVEAHDAYRCPAGKWLTYRMSGIEHGKTMRRYWTTACGQCALKCNGPGTTEMGLRHALRTIPFGLFCFRANRSASSRNEQTVIQLRSSAISASKTGRMLLSSLMCA